MNDVTGFGRSEYSLAFCINNRPQLDDYSSFVGMRNLAAGELDYIVKRTSNHWRKLFNVYAKFLFELGWGERLTLPAENWQVLRDRYLLQGVGKEALLFSQPNLQRQAIHIVAGKTYGLSLTWPQPPVEVEAGVFCVNGLTAVVTPYMDYRQLTNQKISSLVRIVKPWFSV